MDNSQKCQQFIELLAKWNNAYNLTAIRDKDKMLSHHLQDSLSVNNYLQGTRILDVGTGAGLPGIPLAITNPDKQFVLLDSNGKKTRFIQHVIHQLKLDNVEVVQTRVEDFQTDKPFSTIVSRAFASISKYYQMVSHLLDEQTIVLAMQGKMPQQEIDELRSKSVKIHGEPLQVSGLNAERCVVIIQRKSRD